MLDNLQGAGKHGGVKVPADTPTLTHAAIIQMCDCRRTCRYSAESVYPSADLRCWMMYHLSPGKSPPPPSGALTLELAVAAMGGKRCTGVHKALGSPRPELRTAGAVSGQNAATASVISTMSDFIRWVSALWQQVARDANADCPLSVPPGLRSAFPCSDLPVLHYEPPGTSLHVAGRRIILHQRGQLLTTEQKTPSLSSSRHRRWRIV